MAAISATVQNVKKKKKNAQFVTEKYLIKVNCFFKDKAVPGTKRKRTQSNELRSTVIKSEKKNSFSLFSNMLVV